MKVIIPVKNSQKEKGVLVKGFQNTDCCCVYDLETETPEWLPLEKISPNPGNLSFELRRKGIKAVVTNYMSVMALGLFVESGIEVYKAGNDSMQENVELLKMGGLKPYSVQDAMVAESCSSSCGSCKSACY